MAQLNAENIAATALTLLDEQGVEGFSLRAVARVLEVTPMALYRHVRDKAALAMLVVERATDEHPLPAQHDDWREDCWLMASNLRASALAHPAAIELRGAYDIWTPDILARADRWVGNWRASDLPLEKAILAATASSAAVQGLVNAEIRRRAPYNPPLDIDTAAAPNARLLLNSVKDTAAVFELSVRSIIDGLFWRLSQ